MPVYESACATPGCAEFGVVNEWLARSYESPEPDCIECHQPLTRQVSRFGVIWTGPLTGKYLDKSVEGGHVDDGGHWAYRRNSTKDGKPVPVFIDSFSAQRRFCKEEGLGLPQDTGPAKISADGKSLIPISHAEAKDMREANGRAIIAEKKEKLTATA